ncbi:thioredoxin family protein [Cytobacillus spongiae]|uniref:thioredoxin family protein n=1 Tax=Cytobacillus spongiae TaxID=2901381 RepID=UPI001F438DA4|nr:thioredoxin family protein [Cytobacillus spongiae]UII56170.1 thioredoxin family protein [Cytobacillus spongiae]
MVKPYTEGLTFPTLVDSDNQLANYFGFKIVPNGIFIDAEGRICMVKEGFHVTNEEHLQALQQLINGEVEQVKLQDSYYEHSRSETLEKQLAKTKYKLAMEYHKAGKEGDALKELDAALLLDTENFLIRKQRWYIRYPEKFSPTIDIEWQQQQLQQERAEEQKANAADCGPDGCKLPGT